MSALINNHYILYVRGDEDYSCSFEREENGHDIDLEKGLCLETSQNEWNVSQIAKKALSHLKKHVSDLRVSDCGLEIVANGAKILKKEGIEIAASELQRLIKLYQGGQNIYNGKSTYSLSQYLFGTTKEAAQVAKSYFSALTLIQGVVAYVSYAVEKSGHAKELESITNICGVLSPFLSTTLGSSVKILSKYSSLQCALEMVENTTEEKKLKEMNLLKCKADLLAAIAKTGVKLGQGVIPALSNPMVSAALGSAAIGVALIDSYLVYKDLNP